MRYFIQPEKKIIWGWSAKCGCTHLKNIIYFLRDIKVNNVHQLEFLIQYHLPENIGEYDTIILMRNPFKRLVSGFKDKYASNGELRGKWTKDKLTFSLFVDELCKDEWKLVDFHHFIPQTREFFNPRIIESKTLKVFDLENIDYEYIEKIYGKKIPDSLINQKLFNNHRDKIVEQKNIDEDVFDKELDSYIDSKISLKYYYNEDLIKKVFDFFKNDFKFAKLNGIEYNAPEID